LPSIRDLFENLAIFKKNKGFDRYKRIKGVRFHTLVDLFGVILPVNQHGVDGAFAWMNRRRLFGFFEPTLFETVSILFNLSFDYSSYDV